MRTTDDSLRGVLRNDGSVAAVRFERMYETSCADLWSAITEPERLERWLAPVSGDLRAGGSYAIAWEPEVTTGTVLTCETNRRLEVTWDLPGEPSTRVLVTLEDRDGDVHLVLDHAQLPIDRVAGYSAGWHAYLARLVAALSGQEAPDWPTVFAAELDGYRTLAAAAKQ